MSVGFENVAVAKVLVVSESAKTLSRYACAARAARGRERERFFFCILRLPGLGRGTLEEGEQYLFAST